MAAYPFQNLCPHGSNYITLSITDRGYSNYDYLIAPGGTPLTPLYSVYYTDRNKKNGNYTTTIIHHGHEQRTVATVNFSSGSEPEFIFPWLQWKCALLKEGEDPNERWASDVGTLEGHDLEFKHMGWWKEGFATCCHDVDEAWREVCVIGMSNFSSGRLEIPVHLMRDQNGLDEMVVLAVTAMQMQREQLPDTAPEGWAHPRYATDSNSSSSSSSSSSSADSSEKKTRKKGIFGKLRKH